mgnify:CR=1 FL=1
MSWVCVLMVSGTNLCFYFQTLPNKKKEQLNLNKNLAVLNINNSNYFT